ncbi:DUF2231 domain-containing protein (plasmid) [Sphingomonas carotinifaciens]|uniref:DUF2231 domain-containing protein n=1 Tax=Sphingomonas carotinifaciens TaxID=1166323 RepID=UPI0039A00F1E
MPIPIICFAGALITDLAYIASTEMMWLDFSSWLLLAGLIGGGLAGALLIIELIRSHNRRAFVPHLACLLAAWVIAVFNSFIHARDGWTAVVPTGLSLSIAATVLGVLAGWFWQSAYHRPAEIVR